MKTYTAYVVLSIEAGSKAEAQTKLDYILTNKGYNDSNVVIEQELDID